MEVTITRSGGFAGIKNTVSAEAADNSEAGDNLAALVTPVLQDVPTRLSAGTADEYQYAVSIQLNSTSSHAAKVFDYVGKLPKPTQSSKRTVKLTAIFDENIPLEVTAETLEEACKQILSLPRPDEHGNIG